MKRITSRDNPLVKEIVRLAHSARERRRDRVALLDGPHLIGSYLDAGGMPQVAVISDSGLANDEARELFERCSGADRAVLADRVFAQVSTLATPVGVLACASVPPESPLPSTLGDAVIIDQVQDAGNVGAILRTAAAAGIRTVIGSVGTAFFWSPKVLRAGMGAQFFLDVHEHVLLPEALLRCSGNVVAAVLDEATSLYALDLRGPTAWVFGNEGAGISADVLGRTTHRVRIPMPGPAESLNVVAATAACLFEQVRQRTSTARRDPLQRAQ